MYQYNEIPEHLRPHVAALAKAGCVMVIQGLRDSGMSAAFVAEGLKNIELIETATRMITTTLAAVQMAATSMVGDDKAQIAECVDAVLGDAEELLEQVNNGDHDMRAFSRRVG